jgi:ribosomal protein S18 acetylase RimI-like enzyme
MTIVIRQLTDDEGALYRAIRLEALTVSADFFGSAYEDEAARDEAWFAAHLAGAPVWAAFDGDAPIGMAGFNRHVGAKKAHKATLWGMYVAPSARGQGVAESLIQSVLAHAVEAGCEQVLLTCMRGNDRAVRLYERMGFVQFGVEPHALKTADGAYFDDVHMVKRL